jgi:hypothetical protein
MILNEKGQKVRKTEDSSSKPNSHPDTTHQMDRFGIKYH